MAQFIRLYATILKKLYQSFLLFLGMSYQSRGFSQFSPDVSDEEFESVSQVVGPVSVTGCRTSKCILTLKHSQYTLPSLFLYSMYESCPAKMVLNACVSVITDKPVQSAETHQGRHFVLLLFFCERRSVLSKDPFQANSFIPDEPVQTYLELYFFLHELSPFLPQ